MSIVGSFSRTFVVNLPERTDRRREVERMLARIATPEEMKRVEFFPAIRPQSADGFPNAGAKGCFLSHLEILKRAHALQLPNVLVMEDDLEIDDALANPPASVTALKTRPWDMIYFGHVLDNSAHASKDISMTEYPGPITTTHFYAVSSHLLPRLIQFLEELLTRPEGHPDGGPMHVDGAYSTFRQQNPDVTTLVAFPNLGRQRSSRSDITPGRLDHVPIARNAIQLLRRVRRYFRS